MNFILTCFHFKVGASTVTALYSILFLKLWSYIQVNLWCRIACKQTNHKNSLRRQSLSYSNLPNNEENNSQHGSKEELNNTSLVQYPDNLNLRDLFYFIFAPTLCYELNFPRTDRIRKRFLLKRIFEVLVGTQLILCVLQQYMIPSVKNSLIPFSNMDITLASERLLKLAVMFLLGYVCVFMKLL